MVEIELNGVKWPAYVTMGAMLRFKEQTGKEITGMDSESLTELVTYLWCCVVSACAREKRAFDVTLQEFADGLTPEVVGAWSAAIAEGQDEKKTVA